MRKIFTTFVVLVLCAAILKGEGTGDPFNKTYIRNNKEQRSYSKQAMLRRTPAWQQFVSRHQGWQVTFDERTGMPHRAYGQGIQLQGTDPVQMAEKFMRDELVAFHDPALQFQFRNLKTSKYHYVDYYQTYNGLEVLNSRITTRLTHDGRLILFGADVFNDISISTRPMISPEVIASFARKGITYSITKVDVDDALKILPVPAEGKYEYRLVYETTVYAQDEAGNPAVYETTVDAHSGEVLYRNNTVRHFDANVNIKGSVSNNPTVSEVVVNIPYLRIRVNNVDYYTDINGNVTIPGISGPTTATIYMQGTWSKVFEGTASNVTSYTVTLNAGTNDLTLSSAVTLRETSGYYHVSTIHDYMKSWFPGFTDLDDDFVTNVDVNGSCNAFYDGSSVNFYKSDGTCNATSLISDVVYHEYGHGINDKYYDDNGYNFNNGAMDEGYADVWGMALIDEPEIGVGFYKSNDAGIREYQQSIKVYPQDIVGEVHADGEIIAGAWWWTRYNIGTMEEMMAIFTESYNGFASGPNGQEGQVFTDILVDALTADDDNANINDGTPNDEAILSAFALHGITLLGDAVIKHTEPLSSEFSGSTTISTTITMDYPLYFGSAKLHYKQQDDPVYSEVPLTYISGNTYEGEIPPQPKGTIVEYYFTLEDIYGNLAVVNPPGVLDAQPDPNIPYFLLCSYERVHSEDFDNYAGFWQTGDPDDEATTGEWEIDEPQATYQTPGNASSLVQTGLDHTTEGVNTNVCAVTANDVSQNDPYNTQDVDGGATTLYSPEFDLSEYTNPVISYYRWYTNEASANPRNDHWKVFITNDGINWEVVEWNNHPQRAWRNFAFRVSDYVEPNSTVQMKFVAEDSVIASADLEGGSIVEAALDDLYIWEESAGNVGISEVVSQILVTPNPASDFIRVGLPQGLEASLIQLVDGFGRTVYEENYTSVVSAITIPVKEQVPGMFTLKITSGDRFFVKKITVQR